MRPLNLFWFQNRSGAGREEPNGPNQTRQADVSGGKPGWTKPNNYEGNRPNIRGVTYQDAASELEVRHDWTPGEHQLRIVKIEKMPNEQAH